MSLDSQSFEGFARFVNGVFVPGSKVELPENVRVTLRISLTVTQDDEKSDPGPHIGVDFFDWRTRHRIEIDPEMAGAIAEDPQFDLVSAELDPAFFDGDSETPPEIGKSAT